MAAANDIDRGIDVNAIQKILGVSKSWIYRKFKSGTTFPHPKRVGGAVRWRIVEILDYLNSLPDWQSQAEEAIAARAERSATQSKLRNGPNVNQPGTWEWI